MLIELSAEELATIRASLRVYADEGCGDPSKRSDDVHEIATACGDLTSLDDQGIEALDIRLCEALNTEQGGA